MKIFFINISDWLVTILSAILVAWIIYSGFYSFFLPGL